MRIAILATASVFAFGTAGCGALGVGGSKMSVVNASSEQVTMRFKSGDLDEATERARQLCAAHGRTAQIDRVTGGDGSGQIATFDCVYGS